MIVAHVGEVTTELSYSGTCAIRHLSFPTSNKFYGLKVFLLTKIKPEYSNILYNPTNFSGPLVCRIRQVPLYFKIIYKFGWDGFKLAVYNR